MNLNQFAQMRGFQNSHSKIGSFLVDRALQDSEEGEKLRSELKLKRIQFDTFPDLYARLESVCSLLDCSKREFMQMAVWEAVDRAETVFMDSYKEASGRDFMDDFGVKTGE